MGNKALEANHEKRMNERSDCKGIIKWSYFNQSNYFGGELLNGEGGEKMRRVAAEKCDTKCLDNQTI
jgi:hypothetical protein